MAIYSPRGSGLGNSAAYQVAGKPYLTGSRVESEVISSTIYTRREYKVTFPGVTRRIEVSNYCSSSELAVYFSPREASGQSGPLRYGQYAVVPPTSDVHGTSSYVMEIKCKSLFITAAPQGHLTGGITNIAGTLLNGVVNAGSFGVFAELTHIPPADMYQLTGSGINATNYSDGHH